MSLPAPHNTYRGLGGGLVNVLIWFVPLTYLSGWYMDLAAEALGEPVSWPQISFMSAYPEDVRSGYLLVVAAVVTIVFVSSALCGAFFGASLGKAIVGLEYVRAEGAPARFGQHLVRALMMCVVVLMIMTPGPVLGFVFGEAADPYSMLALFVGACAACWLCYPLGAVSGLSPVNRIARMSPVLRTPVLKV